MRIMVICSLMEKVSSLKPKMEMSTFQLSFVLEAYLINLTMLKQKKYHLKESLFDFSVDYDAIDKSDMLNVHKYLMAKSNI